LYQHIRKKEWLSQGFYNGYYDDKKQRVEGMVKGRLRMSLTAQAFALLSGLASQEQARIIFKSACRYLKDKRLGGFRLNTDFQEEQLALGRAFSFAYGDKENGSIFSHMAVMFACGLYRQGLAREGFAVLNSLYDLATSKEGKIYPGLPEYFNLQGRGMYSYLTGSASWFIFTLLGEAFGIRGEYGDLLIEPKLVKEQFSRGKSITVSCSFAGRRLKVSFLSCGPLDYPHYAISQARLNGRNLSLQAGSVRLKIPRRHILALSPARENLLTLLLIHRRSPT
jgi:cellobiose phosphorylase